MEVAPVRSGDLIAEKYVIDRVLGAGGMGVVVAARHLELAQTVAIKFLLEEACEVPGAVERFIREARAAAQIQSEHVARVIDVGRLETGSPYMVMEYLDGIDLAAELQERGTLPPREAVSYMLQAMEALAEAHVANIVHRDLKPANLFLTNRKDGSRSLKVLDFGISKAAPEANSEDDIHLTLTSAMLGSPQYMAPEQVRDAKAVDMRADIWSLGVILYECLSGTVPFGGEMLSGVLAAIVADPPRPLKEVRMDIPSNLAAVVSDCLQKDPRKRIQNVSDLASLLSECEPEASPISVERIYSVMGEPNICLTSSFAKTAAAGIANLDGKAREDALTVEVATTQISKGSTVPPVQIPSKTPPVGTPKGAQQWNPFRVTRALPWIGATLVAAAGAFWVVASFTGWGEALDDNLPPENASSTSLREEHQATSMTQAAPPAAADKDLEIPDNEESGPAETDPAVAGPQLASPREREVSAPRTPAPKSPGSATAASRPGSAPPSQPSPNSIVISEPDAPAVPSSDPAADASPPLTESSKVSQDPLDGRH